MKRKINQIASWKRTMNTSMWQAISYSNNFSDTYTIK